MATSPKEKSDAVKKLGKLLESNGTAMSWNEMAEKLYRLPLPIINGLVYRVERARAEAYEEGGRHERGKDVSEDSAEERHEHVT